MLNFNSSNKSLKMYTNTLSSISGDDLTIKPYDGQTLVLEVSANNNIFIKKGDVSYNLSNLITGAISSNISSSYDSFSNIDGSYASFSNIDVNGNVNPLNDATKSLGGGWVNEYNYTIDTFNGTRSQHKTRAESVPNRYLAVILNASDNNRVRDLIIQNSLPWVWIGGIRLQLGNNGTSSHWKWVTEQPWSYTNWDGGEPGSSEDSVKMHSNGFWHDWDDPASSAAVYITYNSKRWGNAYIRDVSTSNISISGTISVSGNILNVRQIIPQLNINTSLGTDQNTWQKAYIRELINITKINGSNWPITGSIGQTGQTGQTGPTGPTGPAGLPLVATQRVYQHLGKPIYEITTTYMSWQEHNVAAVSQGKTLAVILNTEQMETVRRLIVGSAAYIGAFRTITSNATGKTSADWQWVTGDTWSYTNFAGGEPNTSGEYYLEMYSSGTWNDTQGTGAQRAIYMYYVNDPTLYGSNGYYGLAKDAYPSLNPLSSGVKAVDNWTIRTATQSNEWSSICWSPELGLFVAISWYGTNQIMTSSNGINWIPRLQTESNFWTSVCWSSELRLFVAIATNGTYRVMTSPNGIIWTPASAAQGNTWLSICWSPQLGIFVAVSQDGINRVMTSINGINWIVQSAGEANMWKFVCWSPELGLFVAVAESGNNRVMTSPDGINWTASPAAQNNLWSSVCWSPQLGIFVAVSRNETNCIMYSYNGINWTSVAIYNNVNKWQSISWSPQLGLFVVVANDGCIIYSSNGMNWTLTTSTFIDSTNRTTTLTNLLSITNGAAGFAINSDLAQDALIAVIGSTNPEEFQGTRGAGNIYVQNVSGVNLTTNLITLTGAGQTGSQRLGRYVTITNNGEFIVGSTELNGKLHLWKKTAGTTLAYTYLNSFTMTDQTSVVLVRVKLTKNSVLDVPYDMLLAVGFWQGATANIGRARVYSINKTTGAFSLVQELTDNTNVFAQGIGISPNGVTLVIQSSNICGIYTFNYTTSQYTLIQTITGQVATTGPSPPNPRWDDYPGANGVISFAGSSNIMAIGSYVSSFGVGTQVGYVDIYNRISNNWIFYQRIDGTANQQYFGWSVGFDATGSSLIIGDSRNPPDIYVYRKFTGSSYVEVSTYDAPSIGNATSVGLSADGTRYIVSSGHVAGSAGYFYCGNVITTGIGLYSICWAPELGIFAAVANGGNGTNRVITSSLKGCPPTSYNVFGNETYTINTFTTSGTFTPTFSGTIEVLLVGGGGGGGRALGGGGGGGGVVHLSKVTVTANTSYSIVVGNGGPSGTNGQNTTAFGATAAGGGTSGSYNLGVGIAGGCGGGAAAGQSTLNQGGATSGNIIGANNGINNVGTIYGKPGGSLIGSVRQTDATRGAGGGGAGAPGLNTDMNVQGNTGQYGMGSGGEGIINNILGSSYYWGGGGGGSAHSFQFGGWGGRGGGGGGAGSSGYGGGGAGIGGGFAINSGANGGSGVSANGGAGGPNTGGGGGGGNWDNGSGGSGGSGIVIIRYSTIRPNEIDETGKWTFNNVLIKQPLIVNTTTYTSDDRLKHNEIVIANGLDVIDQLSPKFYQKTQVLLDASYNGDLSDYAWIREAGLIAQELLQISDLSFTVGGGDYYEEKYNLITQTNTISNYYDASSSYYDASSSYYDASSSYYDVSNSYYDASNSYYDASSSYYEISKNLITRPYNVNYNSVFVYGLAAIKELHTKVKAQETSSLDEQINNLVTRVEALELIVD